LYTNPFHAVREYVQNAVDSGATLIRIKLTGNSIIIRDGRLRHDVRGIVKARRFGVSQKNSSEQSDSADRDIQRHDLCNRLLITSYSAGDTMQSVLEFNFSAMKKRLETDKKKGIGTPLHELIERYTRLKIEPSLAKMTGTTVELEEVVPITSEA